MDCARELADNFKQYVDYISEHRNNVLRAWLEMQAKCASEDFVRDKNQFVQINEMIYRHDLSKFSKEEFTQYRLKFYPCQNEQQNDDDFSFAKKHHYANNTHHWQYWVGKNYEDDKELRLYSMLEMICDWQAMGYKKGGNALEHYLKMKDRIILHEADRVFVERISAMLCK